MSAGPGWGCLQRLNGHLGKMGVPELASDKCLTFISLWVLWATSVRNPRLQTDRLERLLCITDNANFSLSQWDTLLLWWHHFSCSATLLDATEGLPARFPCSTTTHLLHTDCVNRFGGGKNCSEDTRLNKTEWIDEPRGHVCALPASNIQKNVPGIQWNPCSDHSHLNSL